MDAIEYAKTVAERFFDLKLPITSMDNLKRAYRVAVKKYHPDTKSPQASEKSFREMKEGYDFLMAAQDNPYFFLGGVSFRPEFETSQGDLLSKLGLGLGPTTSGRECDHCNGKGHGKDSYLNKVFFHTCSYCEGTGEIEMFNPVFPKGRIR